MEKDINVSLYNDDAYNKINDFIDSGLKVDHIITDPPYNISRENNFSTMNSAKRKGIDFGEWDKEFDLYSWILEYSKILKPGGTFIIFTSYRFISYVIDAVENDGSLIVKDLLKWIKSNPMPRNINRRYVQDTEYAIWAVKKGDKWVFNKPDESPYLRAEFHTPVVSGKERTKHPTQKSRVLMEEIINIHTNPKDTILDPFMGSGSTGVAAVNMGRNFVGVELDEEYYNISKNRINTSKNEIRLF